MVDQLRGAEIIKFFESIIIFYSSFHFDILLFSHIFAFKFHTILSGITEKISNQEYFFS